MNEHPFRFGLTAGTTGDLAAWRGSARQAEQLGYSSLLLPDTTATPAPLPALAAAAACTETLHVGPWVLCDPLRPARHLLWEVTTMHRLFGERFELGIGAGRPAAQQDCDRLGVLFGSPSQRLAHLTGTLELVRAEQPDVRIMVAGAGPKMLALAGRVADTVSLGWAPTTTVDAATAPVEAVLAAADGRDVELAAGLIAVGAGEAPWLARMGLDLRDLVAADCVTVVAGGPQEMADTLLRRRERLGISYLTVPANSAEDFAPVVERLAGR